MSTALTELITADPALGGDPMVRLLLPILTASTGSTSSGWPYLEPNAWKILRDRVPHILGMGAQLATALTRIRDRVEHASLEAVSPDAIESFGRAVLVVQQVLKTAAVTAPPTLWLLHHVGGALAEVGVTTHLLAGRACDPSQLPDRASGQPLCAQELETDLSFLQVLGIVDRDGELFRIASVQRATELLQSFQHSDLPANRAQVWADLCRGIEVEAHLRQRIIRQATMVQTRTDRSQSTWMPTSDEVETGATLVDVVLGLVAAVKLDAIRNHMPCSPDPEVDRALRHVLTAAGVLHRDRPTSLGLRVLERGPGPFGIIAAYHPYMDALVPLLRNTAGESVHVGRGANIAASQRANRASFQRANDALDAFCKQTGFAYTVFIEHALGKGEATRQRWKRASKPLTFVGADLEDAAIDAAMVERAAGRLPAEMHFVRGADIGQPSILLEALADLGVPTQDAVMLVGNGFHEVRDHSDERMIEVLRAYCDAGILVCFTEETALSIADQRATAWNTYHQGFRYVHEKSGQGLRPADAKESHASDELAASWTECARAAGYVVVERFSRRGRTIYPTPPPGGQNPSTSVNYFAVPASLAHRVGIA